MNDQSQMMNQPSMMSQAQLMSQTQVMNPVLNQNPAVLVQSQAMNQPPPPPPQVVQSQSQMMSRSGAINQQQQPMMMMNQRSYKPWPPQQQSSMVDPNKKFQFNNNIINNNFVPSKPRSNKNWKGKNINNSIKDQRRMEKPMSNKPNITNSALAVAGPSGGAGGYNPPSLNELQTQNRMKARKYYHPKKKFNNRFAPYAPRNTTSFIIRAKKSGGIASLVSPCPVTPAVLPTPIFSPSREVLGDMAKEEWGVDGYGSMKGLIRLRSPGNEAEVHDDDDEEEGNGSSESDVEEHVEVERRLDHDLSRFEMIYPTYGSVGGDYSYNNNLENRVDDQDTHIAQLEEENLTLKERLFLMERELGDLRRRLQFLERQQGQGRTAMAVEDVNEEVVENVSENDENENESDGGSDVGATGDENNDAMEYVGGNRESIIVSNIDVKESHDVCMEEIMPMKDEIRNKNAGSEFAVKDELFVKEDEAKVEEVRNAPVMGKVIEKELSKDDGFREKITQDRVAVEKDQHKDKVSNVEKSIGGGD